MSSDNKGHRPIFGPFANILQEQHQPAVPLNAKDSPQFESWRTLFAPFLPYIQTTDSDSRSPVSPHSK
jgi:hypothetical protein